MPYALRPRMKNVIDLRPASSAGDSSTIWVENPLDSAHRRYMRGSHFEPVDRTLGRVDAALSFGLRCRVVVKKGEHLARLLQRARDVVDRAGLVTQLRGLFHHALSEIGIVPKPVGAGTLFELDYAPAFARIVKDTP